MKTPRFNLLRGSPEGPQPTRGEATALALFCLAGYVLALATRSRDLAADVGELLVYNSAIFGVATIYGVRRWDGKTVVRFVCVAICAGVAGALLVVI